MYSSCCCALIVVLELRIALRSKGSSTLKVTASSQWQKRTSRQQKQELSCTSGTRTPEQEQEQEAPQQRGQRSRQEESGPERAEQQEVNVTSRAFTRGFQTGAAARMLHG